MSLLKIENFEHLVKDTKTNAVVNTSKSEFQLYMKRRQERNKNGDKLKRTQIHQNPAKLNKQP